MPSVGPRNHSEHDLVRDGRVRVGSHRCGGDEVLAQPQAIATQPSTNSIVWVIAISTYIKFGSASDSYNRTHIVARRRGAPAGPGSAEAINLSVAACYIRFQIVIQGCLEFARAADPRA